MRVEFVNMENEDLIHATEREDIGAFTAFLKSVDSVNLIIDKDYYVSGTVEEVVYTVQYGEDDIPVETLKVSVYDFKDRLKDEEHNLKK